MKKLPFSLRCFAHCIQGQRLHMEDFYSVAYQKKNCTHPGQHCKNTTTNDTNDNPNTDDTTTNTTTTRQLIDDSNNETTKVVHKKHVDYVYFGIFDGHGGKHAAEFAQANLLEFIVSQDDFWEKDDESILRAIKKGFLDTHMAMLDNLAAWPKTIRNLPSTSGTTASVLFIKNGKYYTGHVGDSRIVLGWENQQSKQWIAQSLTVDHKPESPEEKERIQEAGGAVHTKSGVDRVVWQKPILKNDYDLKDSPSVYPINQSAVQAYASIPFLAVARSLGDLWSINSETGKYIVSPEPDVAVQKIGPNDKTIILASDGLWNMVSSADAVRLTQELAESISKYMLEDFYIVDKNDLAKSLVYYAYQQWISRNLRSDNTSAIVVLLEQENSIPDQRPVDSFLDACVDCSCNHVQETDATIKKEPAISLGDRFRFRGSFDLIDFRTEYPCKFSDDELDYLRQEFFLRGNVSVLPIYSELNPPLSHSMKFEGEKRTLNLTNGNTVTIITLPNSDGKGTEPLHTSKSGKIIKNTFTQANRRASQSSLVSRTELSSNYELSSVCSNNNAPSVSPMKPNIPDIWSSSPIETKSADDLVSSKKENAIITEIQKVVQRVSPREVGSIKRKFEGTGLDSIPCRVESLTTPSPIKSNNDVTVRYDMRRRMLESSNGENLYRSHSNPRPRTRKRIRVGSTSPTSKYSPPYRHLRSISLRKSSHQSHLESTKHKQSMKDSTKAHSVMRVKDVRAIVSSLSNRLPKTRLRPRLGLRPRRSLSGVPADETLGRTI